MQEICKNTQSDDGQNRQMTVIIPGHMQSYAWFKKTFALYKKEYEVHMHHICMTYAYMQSYALYKQIYAHICRHGRHLQGICKAHASICKHMFV